jgi:hypothetical protein
MAHTARTAAPTNRSNRPVISGYPKKAIFNAPPRSFSPKDRLSLSETQFG